MVSKIGLLPGALLAAALCLMLAAGCGPLARPHWMQDAATQPRRIGHHSR